MLGYLNVLGVALETDRGVAETIATGDCNLLVSDLSFTFNPTSVEITPVLPAYGSVPNVIGGTSGSVSFNAYFKTSALAGTPPAIGKLFKACGMIETIEDGRVKYAPTSTLPTQTCTIKSFPGLVKSRTLKGCVGTFNFSAEGNTPFVISFTFTGVYEDDGDETALATSFESTSPIPFLKGCVNLLEYHERTNEDLANASAGYVLNSSLATDVAFLIENTEACELKRLRIHMTRLGNPTGVNGIRVLLHPDAAGEPNTAVTTGTSAYILPETVSDAGDYQTFVFNVPPSLAVADYWARVQGDYPQSDLDNVTVTSSVSASGNVVTYNGATWDPEIDDVVCRVEVSTMAHVKVNGMTMDYGNTVNLEQDVCADEGWTSAFVGRRASTGSIEPQEELSADRDFFANLISAVRLSLSFIVGPSSGHYIEFNAPYTQISGGGSLGNRDDLLTAPLDLKLNSGMPSTVGNDEVEIIFY